MKLSRIAAMVAVAALSAFFTQRADAQTQSQFAFGISGGVTLPEGAAKDSHKPGGNGTVMLGLGSIDSPFGIRFDGMYSTLGGRKGAVVNQGAARVTSISANVVFDLYGSSSRVYFVGGAGGFGYNPQASGVKTVKDFAINAGLGLWLPWVDGFVEARWFNLYRALPDATSGLQGKKSVRIYPINVGFMF